MANVARLEKPPFIFKVKIGPMKYSCDSIVRSDRYFSRMPLSVLNLLPTEVCLERISDEIKSVEETSRCTGVVLINIEINNRFVENHKVLVSVDEELFSLGSITLFGLGAVMDFRLQKISFELPALKEIQLKKFFKTKYGEREVPQELQPTNPLKNVQCYICNGWGHMSYHCNQKPKRKIPYTVGNSVNKSKSSQASGSQVSGSQASRSQTSGSQASGFQKSTAQRSTAQNATAQNATAQNATAQNATAQNSTAQNSTAQNSTAQKATAQPSTLQSSVPQVSTSQVPQYQGSSSQESISLLETISTRPSMSSPILDSLLDEPLEVDEDVLSQIERSNSTLPFVQCVKDSLSEKKSSKSNLGSESQVQSPSGINSSEDDIFF